MLFVALTHFCGRLTLLFNTMITAWRRRADNSLFVRTCGLLRDVNYRHTYKRGARATILTCDDSFAGSSAVPGA